MVDRQIQISKADSCKSKKWVQVKQRWSEFVEELRVPRIVDVTLDRYSAMDTQQQLAYKDGKGFVGGVFATGQRKHDTALGQDLIRLDYDAIPKGFLPEFLQNVNAMNCSYVLYTTIGNSEDQPKIRLIIPTDRTMTAEEHQPVSRKLADILCMQYCDQVSFRVNQLMFYPSSRVDDTAKLFLEASAPLVSVDSILGMYTDWRDINEWAKTPREPSTRGHRECHQASPRDKTGMVGACCRIYDMYRGIDKYFPTVYETTSDPDTYRLISGGAIAGLKIYDGGDFAYSYHSTDPVSGKNVNFFDLMRVHMFGHLDENPFVYGETTKSYDALCKFLKSDPEVMAEYNRERNAELMAQFKEFDGGSYDDSWLYSKAIKRNDKGVALKTVSNVEAMLELDPRLRDKIRFNTFTLKKTCINPLPWGVRASAKPLTLKGVNIKSESTRTDSDWVNKGRQDTSGLIAYCEKMLGINTPAIIETALANYVSRHSYNPLQEYLNSVVWDGVPRLDTLYIDYFNAEDTELVRAVNRKAFVAAVARAFDAGCLFQTCTVLIGATAIGKSTFFKKLGREWFTDDVSTFDGKAGAELIQSYWIIELGEMEAYSKTKDTNTALNFIGRSEDNQRFAYAEDADTFRRKCVFFGTTNNPSFIRTHAGNRKIWAVPLHKTEFKMDTSLLTSEKVDQIWAEAVYRYLEGETLFLSQELELEMKKVRESSTETEEYDGMILKYLATPVPQDWETWTLNKRRDFMNTDSVGAGVENPSTIDRICTQAIWMEVLGMPNKNIPPKESRRINMAMDRVIPNWKITEMDNVAYTRQRGRKRPPEG